MTAPDPAPAAAVPVAGAVAAAVGAFGARLGWGRHPALLLIDLMEAYFSPGSPFDLGTREPVHRCADLLAAARSSAVPVLHSRVVYQPGAVDGGRFVQKVPGLRVLAEGTGGGLGALVPEVAPHPHEVVVLKQYASSFFGTSLAATLTAAGVDTLVMAGVSTSGCVRATATDAIQHGFRPLVVGEACADRTVAIHEANLADLDAKYADVISLAEAVAGLDAR